MSVVADTAVNAAKTQESMRLRDHLVAKVGEAKLDRDPFCHIYIEEIFPAALYPSLLQHLPAPSLYSPLNLRLYSRGDGESTRDQFYLTAESLAKLPAASAAFWSSLVRAVTDGALKRAAFAKLAPDLSERFDMPADRVPDMDCTYEVVLFRDTQDYRIKPHPDGLNKIVTMQFYLAADDSNLELGTSLYRRRSGLFGGTFEEAKRFPFKPNSAYAFAVSDSAKRKSWHGRDRLTGFTGVRNTLMVLFQRESPRDYAM
jgi:hypothetical protein